MIQFRTPRSGCRGSDLVHFLYRDYGLDIYGNGLAASRAFLKSNPEAVRGFIRATLNGVRDMVRDPDEAVRMTTQFEPLLNAYRAGPVASGDKLLPHHPQRTEEWVRSRRS